MNTIAATVATWVETEWDEAEDDDYNAHTLASALLVDGFFSPVVIRRELERLEDLPVYIDDVMEVVRDLLQWYNRSWGAFNDCVAMFMEDLFVPTAGPFTTGPFANTRRFELKNARRFVVELFRYGKDTINAKDLRECLDLAGTDFPLDAAIVIDLYFAADKFDALIPAEELYSAIRFHDVNMLISIRDRYREMKTYETPYTEDPELHMRIMVVAIMSMNGRIDESQAVFFRFIVGSLSSMSPADLMPFLRIVPRATFDRKEVFMRQIVAYVDRDGDMRDVNNFARWLVDRSIIRIADLRVLFAALSTFRYPSCYALIQRVRLLLWAPCHCGTLQDVRVSPLLQSRIEELRLPYDGCCFEAGSKLACDEHGLDCGREFGRSIIRLTDPAEWPLFEGVLSAAEYRNVQPGMAKGLTFEYGKRKLAKQEGNANRIARCAVNAQLPRAELPPPPPAEPAPAPSHDALMELEDILGE